MQNKSTNESSNTRIRISPGYANRSGANATEERGVTGEQSIREASTRRPTTSTPLSFVNADDFAGTLTRVRPAALAPD